MPARLPAKTETAITAQYRAGSTVASICRDVGVCSKTVYNVLDRHGVAVGRYNTHEPNEHVFDVVDSEAKAYWLGFLAADGNIQRYVVRLELATKDEEHVRRFAAFAGVAENVRTYARGSVAVWVGSRQLAESVRSFTRASIAGWLVPHYWRGVVDGDGSINWQRRRTCRHGGNWNLTLSSDLHLVRDFATFVAAYGVRKTPRYERGCWRVDYFGGRARPILAALYHGATVYLPRKSERAHCAFSGAEEFAI